MILPGGVAFAAAGVWRIAVLDPDASYLADYLPSLLLTGVAVSMCIPQLASVTAQALPANRLGVGGATNQAVRQLGGTIGVALSIAFIGTGASGDEVVSGFNRIWILLCVGGIATSVLGRGLTRRAGAG